MRTAFFAASLAAGALAAPRHQHKRAPVPDIATTVDVVVVTDVAVVTVYGASPTDSVAAATTTDTTEAASTTSSNSWHHHWTHSWGNAPSSAAPSSSEAPVSSAAPSSPAPAPSSYAAPSSSAAPPPPSSAAPSTSAAPTSTEAPSSSWAPASSQAPSSSAAPSSTSSSDDTSYSGVAVAHHNIHRANHSAPGLEWDDGLASTAEKIASTCNYAHSMNVDGGGYGQNIAAGVEAANISAIITDLFYNGEVGWYADLYGQPQPDMTNFEHWGHFSQIVWKDTTHVGCATYDCTSQGLGNVGSDVAPFFTVCNYKNPGNYANEYGTNVGVPLNEPTAEWNTGSSVS